MRLDGDRWEDVTSDAFPDGGVQPFATSIAEDGKVRVMAGGRYSSPRADQARALHRPGLDRRRRRLVAARHRPPAGRPDLRPRPLRRRFRRRRVRGLGASPTSRSAGDDTSPDGLLWTSPDGKEWTRIAARLPEERPTTCSQAWPRTSTPPTRSPPPSPTEEASQPRESLAPIGGSGTRSLEAVAPLGKGFIAVGVSCCDDPGEPIVVVSRDGKSIERQDPGLGGAGTQRFRDVCVGPDDTAIAVGITGSDGDYDAAVRVRTPTRAGRAAPPPTSSFTGAGSQQIFGCAASEDGFVAVGSDDRTGDADARVWTSTDGKSWTRVDSRPVRRRRRPDGSAVDAVPDGGWLVGGGDTAPGDGDIALWRVDADGVDVERDEGEPELSGPGEQSVTNLMVDDDGVTIVGDDFGRVGIWQSDTIDR